MEGNCLVVAEEPKTPDAEQPPSEPKQTLKREIIELVKMVAWFLVLFLLLRTFVIEGYEVQGESMEPTLHDGERILVLKLPHLISRHVPFCQGLDPIEDSEIIVFRYGDDANKRYVKRVIAHNPSRSKTVEAGNAEAGPTVAVRMDRGDLFVNNRRRPEPYIEDENRLSRGSFPEKALSSGTYYVLGDNRPNSKDSRSIGAVNDDQVVGEAVLRFWPLSKFGPL